jgi:hypothetical protein
VSGLYSTYRGESTYFWQAQQLTHNDYSDHAALNEAFLFIVSGIEDQKDIVDLPRELPIEEMAGQLPTAEAERVKAMYQVYHKVFLRSSMSAETSINGMYVATKPRLGLALGQNEKSMTI